MSKQQLLLFGVAFALLLPVVVYELWNRSPSYDPVGCPEEERGRERGECFFRENYYQAREQFLNLAQRCGAEIYHLPVVEEREGEREKLTTEVAILRGSPERYLIHLSGTHGVEGYSGSAIQAAALHSIWKKKSYQSDKEPTLIFIHSLNPYGFHHNRRVNEDNIDLNRNFLNPDQFAAFQIRDANHAGYETMTDIFNPTSAPLSIPFLNDLVGIWRTIRVALKVGIGSAKGALVAGTYHNPAGLFYGGKSLSKSAQNIEKFFADMGINEIRKYVVVDVHTGLGPSGVDTMLIHDEEKGCKNRTEKYFPTEYSSDDKGNQIGGIKPWLSGDAEAVENGYEQSSGFTTDYFCDWLLPNFLASSRICFTQEFGTFPSILVAKGFVDENQAYHYGSNEQKKFYGERLKRLFFIQRNEWMRSVVKRGTTVISQALDYLRE